MSEPKLYTKRLGKIQRDDGKNMRVNREFVRRCKLTTTQFRVLMHGLSYPSGWTVRKCVYETGLSLPTVKRTMSFLTKNGYVWHQPNPLKPNQWGYKFKHFPSMSDEKRPWFAEMNEANNGDLEGIAFPARETEDEYEEEIEEDEELSELY